MSEDGPSKVRIGILSTAAIAHKNWLAVCATTNAEVTAVCSRSREKAEAWAKEHNIATVYGSYDELLDDKEVDAVYIPLPTGLHKEWTLRAAAKGKHVLLEKPVGRNADEVREMVAACESAGVQFMDGTMFMHHKRLGFMSKRIHDEEALGPLRRVTSAFSFSADPSFLAGDIRVKHDLEPLGSLGDIGWYCIRFSLWAFKYEMPAYARATNWEFNSDGVPMTFDATLYWADGRVASFSSSFLESWRQWAEVVGSHSVLYINDFSVANSPESCSFTIAEKNGLLPPDNQSVITDKAVTEVKHCLQEREMIQNFAELVLKIKSEGRSAVCSFWPKVSLMTQVVLDACLASAAVDGARVPVARVD